MAILRLLGRWSLAVFWAIAWIARAGISVIQLLLKWSNEKLGLLAKSPLFMAVLPIALGYGVFLLQTRVERANQLQQARFTALQELTSLYGGMIGNLDSLENARCEIMMGRLKEQGISDRSREMQLKIIETQTQAEGLKYKIAVLFSPSTPWYKRPLRWISKLNPASGYRPSVVARDGEDMLSKFQDFYQHYLRYQEIALYRAKVVPHGIPCEKDDRTYLEGFHGPMSFKLIRIYNHMAELLGVSKLELDIRKKANWEVSQAFRVMIGGREIRLDCRENRDGTQNCFMAGERPKGAIQ